MLVCPDSALQNINHGQANNFVHANSMSLLPFNRKRVDNDLGHKRKSCLFYYFVQISITVIFC